MQNTVLSGSCGCDSLPPAHTNDLMSISQARAKALQDIKPITETQIVSLDAAGGRVTAQDVIAVDDMPHFDNSAMDGFAINCKNHPSGGLFPIAGTVAAGNEPRTLPAGTALRIYTGAPLPDGANAVVMVEQSVEIEGSVQFSKTPVAGQNIRRKGSDQTSGDMIIPQGTNLSPHHIGLLAANGINTVTVARKPKVGVFSTGDELAVKTRGRGQIPDANRPLLLALLSQAGADATDLGILPDNLTATVSAFKELGDRFDLILTSGAVSMGGKDHIREALVAAGGDVSGWRVALKPGKPIMFGTLGNAVFTGLPGNPFAAYVGFHLFVTVQLSRLQGIEPSPFASVPACAGFEWSRRSGRAEVFPVRLQSYDASGTPVLERLGKSVSATLLPLSTADGLAIVAAETDSVVPGDRLYWQPLCQPAGALT